MQRGRKKRLEVFDGLTREDVAFLNAYFLENFSLSKACNAAGLEGPWPTLHAYGTKVLNKPEVRAFLDLVYEGSSLNREQIIMRLSEQALGIWAEYIDSNGQVDLAKMAEDRRMYLIQQITPSTRPGGPPNIRFVDSQKALEMLARIRGMFTDNVKETRDVLLRVQYGSDGGENQE